MDAHQVGCSAHSLWVKHDNLRGDVTLDGLRHVFHCAVDGRVFNLEPVISIPSNQKPDILLPIQLLLKDLRCERGPEEKKREEGLQGEQGRRDERLKWKKR